MREIIEDLYLYYREPVEGEEPTADETAEATAEEPAEEGIPEAS